MPTHGSKLYFAVEDSAGSTLRNISTYVTGVDKEEGNDQHDVTTAGATGHVFQNGLRNGKFTVNGFWDKTASTGASTVLDSLLGIAATVGFEYGPEGNTNGNVKYSGEVNLETLTYSEPVTDMCTFTAVFQVSGVVTKGTFSA